jgi:hypothetical protein
MYWGNADAAGNTGHTPVFFNVGREPQRSYKVPNAVPCFKGAQFPGGLAYLLENTGDSAFFTIKISYSEGNPLPFVMDAQYDELPGGSLTGYHRRFYLK